MNPTMKAVVFDRYGDPEVLELREVPVPRPGPQEVLIAVHACGLNPVDYKIRHGALKDLFAVTFPRILGGDISGVIQEIGSEVSDFLVGDTVYLSQSLDKDGGYAEYCVADQSLVAKKPSSLSHLEAASLPVAGLTSIQALRDFGGIQPNQNVLIHAGAGGVGSFAIQYAKHCGAKVFTTTSQANADYVRSLGADVVIDYRNEDFVKVSHAAGGMHLVLESIGGWNYPKSIEATHKGGAVPCVVNPPDADTKTLSESRGVKTDFMLLTGKRSDLNEITRLVETGVIKPCVSKVLSMENLIEGHRLLESGRTRGKLLLQVK